MDFKDELKQIGARVDKLKDQIQTEEATKNAFIMPFLNAMGYDVFNPLEVVPEFTADVGLKKGEKIDYAIFKDGVPIILIECKHWAQNLDLHSGQLIRYFNVSKAKIGILTNGIIYRFYSDLVEPNKMDEKPFLEFDVTKIKDNQVEDLKQFNKSYFDIESIINSASDLKITKELKQCIQDEFTNPSNEFVRLLTKQVYSGTVTQKVLDQFIVLTKKSIQEYINELINNRLQTALKNEDRMAQDEQIKVEPVTEDSKIDTTEEELEGFMIVKTILRQKIEASRVTYRDAQSYFAILLDDNNRKTICRLYFNTGKKYISTFDSEKKETKNEILTLDDIFNYSEELFNIVEFYDK